MKDYGYTVEKCKQAIAACGSLGTTTGEKDYWDRVILWWEAQLAFAEAASRKTTERGRARMGGRVKREYKTADTIRFPKAEKVLLKDRCQAQVWDNEQGHVQCKLEATIGEWCWLHGRPERHPERA